eukprot:TRINITY_DN46488_c0_g1_i2.p1 TRINITY_DN46488_c0_g1~~TRINITY_DN46488_c0_g1_i2.p1  ORF type:complete len:314 (-),score=48.06 TRINITY_DN46488_c0_g1_i2:79-1020(-)
MDAACEKRAALPPCGAGHSSSRTGGAASSPHVPAGNEERLVSLGQELIRKLEDSNTDPQELSDIVSLAATQQELPGILAARDGRGRSPLHVAATRGDQVLCRQMLKGDPSIVNVADNRKNTPIMDASLCGRSLIVKDLIDAVADVTLKNADCMSALQLACVNEGAGNGQVVEDLVRAGADPSAMCWQTTPLMAAADSGHSWALRMLIELGADPWFMNSSNMTALDYARDLESAEFLYDVMKGDKLLERPALNVNRQRLLKNADERRARLHQASRSIALEDAWAVLELARLIQASMIVHLIARASLATSRQRSS